MSNELLDTDKLTGWLKNQPPDGEYVWSDPVFCLMGRYLADNGSEWGAMQYSDLPLYEEIAKEKPWTFGAALERAEALKALPPPPLQIAAPVEAREPVTVDAG
jgi:hypothetical protein